MTVDVSYGGSSRRRIRRQRRQAMREWAPGASPPGPRTGRWLLALILAVAALVILFPLAVDALRRLVAL